MGAEESTVTARKLQSFDALVFSSNELQPGLNKDSLPLEPVFVHTRRQSERMQSTSKKDKSV